MQADLSLDHVQITVRREDEAACLAFYRTVLQLPEIPKPENLQRRGGAWFRIGRNQLHVSSEEMPAGQNEASKRHVCLRTNDLESLRRRLQDAGVKLIPDDQPIPGVVRFYVRDPGGYRLELMQLLEPT
jgi:catechol 2,3-dioxygenase-like lactoylglutathione lyase family enzyme